MHKYLSILFICILAFTNIYAGEGGSKLKFNEGGKISSLNRGKEDAEEENFNQVFLRAIIPSVEKQASEFFKIITDAIKKWGKNYTTVEPTVKNFWGVIYAFGIYILIFALFMSFSENFLKVTVRNAVVSFKMAGIQTFKATWDELDKKTERNNRLAKSFFIANFLSYCIILSFFHRLTPIIGVILGIVLAANSIFFIFSQICKIFFSYKPYTGKTNMVLHNITLSLLGIGSILFISSVYVYYYEFSKSISRNQQMGVNNLVYLWLSLYIILNSVFLFYLFKFLERKNEEKNLINIFINFFSKEKKEFHNYTELLPRNPEKLRILKKVWFKVINFFRKVIYFFSKGLYKAKVFIKSKLKDFLQKIHDGKFKNLFNESFLSEIIVFIMTFFIPYTFTIVYPEQAYLFYKKIERLVIPFFVPFTLGFGVIGFSVTYFFDAFGFLSIVSPNIKNGEGEGKGEGSIDEGQIKLFGQED